jgi:YegS/Rv2252/BmrU family lipid kinase
MSTDRPRRIQVIVNPASGRDEPVLNTLNDVFRAHGVRWDARVTHRYGDAARLAREAVEDGADIVAGYGGDGTQHEIANALVRAALETGRTVPLGVLPGGTGNGFSRELGLPRTLREAAELLCTSDRLRLVDVGRARVTRDGEVREELLIQRLYLAMEPDQQTSREEKDRYGVLAYPMSLVQRRHAIESRTYQLQVDGEAIEAHGTRIYVVNSGMSGSGLPALAGYAIDDGLLDCYLLDRDRIATLTSAAERFLDLRTADAARTYRSCRSITLDATPDQPVWADGEHIGRTPVSVDVLPGALHVLVGDTPPKLGVLHRGFDRLYPAIRFTYEEVLGHEWFTQVTPVLWLGGAPSKGADLEALLKLGISAVVDVRAERDAPEAFYTEHGIAFRRYRVPDTRVPGPEVLSDAVAWMRDQIADGRSVLVHCSKGRGRSATVLAAYLMATEGWSFDEVDALLRAKRSLVKLQPRHRQALEAWAATGSGPGRTPDSGAT